MKIFCVFGLVILCSHLVSPEVFTAISDVEMLLHTQKKTLEDLDFYLHQEEVRIATLKETLSKYKMEHDRAMEDTSYFLGNPINAFTLIKRLSSDLEIIVRDSEFSSHIIKNITSQPDLKYPTPEDLKGAADALMRLKKTYKLTVEDLAEGKLNGVSYGAPMTTDVCYEMGRILYSTGEYSEALPWFLETLRKYREDDQHHIFTEADIMETIAYIYSLKGDDQNALIYMEQVAKLQPDNENIKDYLVDLRDMANTTRAYNVDIYESLCRGEMKVHKDIAKRLKCWYMTKNHPFLKLAPIKTEQVHISPDIWLFHQVITDDEIEIIKEMAQPKFLRAAVIDSKTGGQIPAEYRISKSSWLHDEDSPAVARISRRVQDMTGLDQTETESLQVVNYGVGGHYEPHYDFSRNFENTFKEYPFNRIATVLFYMSDVEQGGATVFTQLGLSVFPVKNAAVFWLNLHPSGEGDLSTRHAACPVLQGSKWVSNKWIHQAGQEFIRPCTLEYQEES